METRRVNIDDYGARFVYLKNGDYALTYNTLTQRCATAQFAPRHFKLILTDHEEFIGIFRDSNELYALKESIEQIRSILDS